MLSNYIFVYKLINFFKKFHLDINKIIRNKTYLSIKQTGNNISAVLHSKIVHD